MTAKEKTIIRIIKQYREMLDFIKKNNFDYSDYEDEGVAKELVKGNCFVPLQEDLVDLCEDNEAMRESIVNYFEESVDIAKEA